MKTRVARTGPGLLVGLLIAIPCRPAGADAACTNSIEQQLADLVNIERIVLGHPPLLLDVRLNAAARRHAEDLRAGCFLSHTGSDGSSARERMADAGYPDGLGEVAAAGSWPYPPQQVVDSWMASSAHRNILMNTNARHIGMALAAHPQGCPLQGHEFVAGGFWVGKTGAGTGSEFSELVCCPEPGGEPICVPEPGAIASGLAALLALAGQAWRRRRLARAGARSL